MPVHRKVTPSILSGFPDNPLEPTYTSAGERSTVRVETLVLNPDPSSLESSALTIESARLEKRDAKENGRENNLMLVLRSYI